MALWVNALALVRLSLNERRARQAVPYHGWDVTNAQRPGAHYYSFRTGQGNLPIVAFAACC
jgi:hypothetical protein